MDIFITIALAAPSLLYLYRFHTQIYFPIAKMLLVKDPLKLRILSRPVDRFFECDNHTLELVTPGFIGVFLWFVTRFIFDLPYPYTILLTAIGAYACLVSLITNIFISIIEKRF